MASRPLDSDEALAPPLYALAAFLLAMPAADFLQGIGAPQPGSVQWRFATIGLLSSYLAMPLVGLALAVVVAAVREHRVVQRILALTNIAGAVMLVCLVALFVLDALQLRSGVPAEARGNMESASLRAVLKHVAAAAVLGWLGLRGYRVSAWRAEKTSRKTPVPLISK